MVFSAFAGTSVAGGVSALSKQYLFAVSDSGAFNTIFPNLPSGKEKGGTGGVFPNPDFTGVFLLGGAESQIVFSLTVSEVLLTGTGIEKAENYEFSASGTAIGDLQISKLKELNETMITFYCFDYKSVSSLDNFGSDSTTILLDSGEYTTVPLLIDNCQLSVKEHKNENGKISRVNFTVTRKNIPSLTDRIWQATTFAQT